MTATARLSQDDLVALHDEACALVGAAFSVSREALMESRTRGRGKGKASFARQIAMYLLKLQGVGFVKVGLLFGRRSISTVQHACAVVEDARDDPALDAQLDALEITLYRRFMRYRRLGRKENGVVSKQTNTVLP